MGLEELLSTSLIGTIDHYVARRSRLVFECGILTLNPSLLSWLCRTFETGRALKRVLNAFWERAIANQHFQAPFASAEVKLGVSAERVLNIWIDCHTFLRISIPPPSI